MSVRHPEASQRRAFAPADQPAERPHHPAHREPQRRRPDEGHDHLHHRRTRSRRRGQNDRGQGRSSGGAGAGNPVQGLQPPTVPLPRGRGDSLAAPEEDRRAGRHPGGRLAAGLGPSLCVLRRWRARRPSPGSRSSGTAGTRRRSTASPTSATPRSSTPTSTWATRRGWSSRRSPTGETRRRLRPGLPGQAPHDSGRHVLPAGSSPRLSSRHRRPGCPAEAERAPARRPAPWGPCSHSLTRPLAVWPRKAESCKGGGNDIP